MYLKLFIIYLLNTQHAFIKYVSCILKKVHWLYFYVLKKLNKRENRKEICALVHRSCDGRCVRRAAGWFYLVFIFYAKVSTHKNCFQYRCTLAIVVQHEDATCARAKSKAATFAPNCQSERGSFVDRLRDAMLGASLSRPPRRDERTARLCLLKWASPARKDCWLATARCCFVLSKQNAGRRRPMGMQNFTWMAVSYASEAGLLPLCAEMRTVITWESCPLPFSTFG